MKTPLFNCAHLLAVFMLANIPNISAQETTQSIQVPHIVNAKPIKRKAPKYPVRAAQNGQEGWVVLSFVIDKNGEVVDPIVEDSSGLRSFNKSALKSIKGWKYSPATNNGEKIEQSHSRVKIDFRLKKGGGITKDFLFTYKELITALGNNELDEAKTLLEEIYNDQLWNYTESSFYWLADSVYAKAIGDSQRELSSVNKALATKNKKIQMSNILYLLKRQFALNVSSTYFVEGLASYKQLKKLPNSEKIVEQLKPHAQKIIELMKSEEPLIRHAVVNDNSLLIHRLSRNIFSLVVNKGELTGIEVRCDNKRAKFDYRANSEWDIPAIWGRCNLIVSGEENSKVDIIELSNKNKN